MWLNVNQFYMIFVVSANYVVQEGYTLACALREESSQTNIQAMCYTYSLMLTQMWTIYKIFRKKTGKLQGQYIGPWGPIHGYIQGFSEDEMNVDTFCDI